MAGCQTAGDEARPRTEDAFYYTNQERTPVVVRLDQVGVVTRDGVSPDRVSELAARFKLQVSRVIPDNFVVLGVGQARTREGLLRLARDLKRDPLARDLVLETGLIMAWQADPETPILLSDEFIALFSRNVSRGEIDAFGASLGVEVVAPDPFVAGQFLLRVTERSPSDALEMANRYEESPLTVFSHPNFWPIEERLETVPTDPLFPNQWHHRNTGQSGGLVDADADTSWAWDLTLGIPNVLIAVIDDGFDTAHEDLAPNLFINPGEIAGNGIDDDANGFVDDVSGWDFVGAGDNDPSPGGASDNHGTAVAGVALARGGNSLGVSGSAPNCSFLPIRRGYAGFSEQAKANAFGYAQAMGANVLNNSWGHSNTASVVSTVVTNAINNATAAGVLVVFAAGNANSAGWCGASYPSLPNVFAVSSSTNQDLKVTAAAFGNCVDILAPSHRGYSPPYNGTLNVTTTDRTGTPGYNSVSPLTNCPLTEPGTNYTHCFGGTSSAAPLTAGVAALVLSADMTLTPTEVRRLLQDTADKIVPATASYSDINGFSTPASGVATHSWGRLNAFEAVRIAAPTASGGRAGTDLVLGDNLLDWGNTSGYEGQQASNVRFESPRGFIGHWASRDIKVDAPPYHAVLTAANFDATPDEKPSAIAGEVNRVFLRVRNRGPNAANTVTVKLYWTQFGTALPPLPGDFWSLFPADSSAAGNAWTPLQCSTGGTNCTLTNVAYSGSSVAGTGADAAQVARFDFPAPPLDPALSNHFCLLAIVDSPDDPVDPRSKTIFVVDAITPNDNNVTHRNYQNLDSGEGGSSEQRFFVRNPLREPIRAVLHLADPGMVQKGWRVEFDRFGLDDPFPLKAGEAVLVTMKVTPPARGVTAELTLVQERADFSEGEPVVMGGLTLGFAPRKRE